jgi:hypothetical protein
MAAQSFTDTEIDAKFTAGILPESVYTSNRSPGSSGSPGLLTDTYIKSYIAGLKTSGKIPVLTATTNENAYSNNVINLLTACKNEYNHYYVRYVYVLNTLFTNIRDQYNSPNTPDNLEKVKKTNEKLLLLNTKLNDLIQIMQGISDDMLQSSNAMDTELTAFQANMAEKKQKLQYQTEIIKSNQNGTKLSKEMVKYTEENARYTDNLLKMYSFLNVVALGLLIYIYRAAN